MKVSHLHFHTEHSLQDSLLRIDKLGALVEEYSIAAIALTDHGNVDGAVKFYQEMKKTSAVPLLGCELYVVDDMADRTNRHRYHLVAIAKNRRGFTSIMRALTKANLDGFYYRPRVDWKYILSDLEDVVVMTACADGPLSHPDSGEIISALYEKFGEDFYLEAVLLRNYKPQQRANVLVRELSAALGIRTVFTADVHYQSRDDFRAREVVSAIHRHARFTVGDWRGIKEEDRADLHLKTFEEMEAAAIEAGWGDRVGEEMAEVWEEIVGKCTFDLEPCKVSIPLAYEEAEPDPGAFLRAMCEERFSRFSYSDEKAAHERMVHELDEIISLGFAEYFLLVEDVVRWSKENGIRVGPGRGSVGGSLAAYVLGITDVNPLDYDLVFERFISPGRHDLPDIDIDFEDQKRDQIIQYLKEKYGLKSVALVSTFSSMKGRGAIRDVSRVFDVPAFEVNQVTKQILVRSGGDARSDFTIEDTVTLFEHAKDFTRKYPHVIEVSKAVEGLTKTKGVHAAGVVVDKEDLTTGERCVLSRGNDGELVINWDKKDLEYMGLMKMDVLGLKTLNILSRAADMVHEKTGQEVIYTSLPFDDKKVLKAFFEADCLGIFQFGSAGMIQYLREFRPRDFTELYQANALYRPGTLRSGLATKFIDLKQGRGKADSVCRAAEEILRETHGIVLFQEQIMFILNRLGGVPWRTTDMIRKVISKSEGQEKFETFRLQFLEGARRLKSMTDEEANEIFRLMKYFGSYGFNKSHSVEYTYLGYWMMWLKVYFPAEFYCALLQRADDKAEISGYLGDAERHGISHRLPDINESAATWGLAGEKALIAGLDIIRGISERVAEEIVKAREEAGGLFRDFFHFTSSVPKRLVNVAKVKALLNANAFSRILSNEDRLKILAYIAEHKGLPGALDDVKGLRGESVEIPFDVFNFEIVEDFYGSNRVLVDLIEKRLDVKPLTVVMEAGERGILPRTWYLGKFEEIKFGYRSKVSGGGAAPKRKGDHGSDLGGVYGVFRDKTYHSYVTFTGRLYNQPDKKGAIEDAAGKIVLLEADKPNPTGNLFAHRFHLLDDIRVGRFEGLDLGGLVDAASTADLSDLAAEISACEACAYREDCDRPTPFSSGRVGGVLVIGEAPGREEEKAGKPFLGRAGAMLWEMVGDWGLRREDVFVSNVLKCRPRDNKISDARLALACADRWLRKEIERLQPRVIFSLGRTAAHFLLNDRKAGVMERNAKTEWVERFGAFVVFSIHPAMVLYDAKNRGLLEESVESFARLFSSVVS